MKNSLVPIPMTPLVLRYLSSSPFNLCDYSLSRSMGLLTILVTRGVRSRFSPLIPPDYPHLLSSEVLARNPQNKIPWGGTARAVLQTPLLLTQKSKSAIHKNNGSYAMVITGKVSIFQMKLIYEINRTETKVFVMFQKLLHLVCLRSSSLLIVSSHIE